MAPKKSTLFKAILKFCNTKKLFRKFYCDTIQKLIDTHKIKKINKKTDTKNDRIFYIPHFVTRQAKKRLMYDGSAKRDDISLNSMLYQGRDKLQKLYHVLMRFRRFSVAFCSDI